MIIVHDTFVCKPGNASKLAKLFKESMVGNKELVNIMSDMTGQYNRVIMVSKYENLTAYENSWKQYEKPTKKMSAKGGSASGGKEAMAKMANYTDMYLTGS